MGKWKIFVLIIAMCIAVVALFAAGFETFVNTVTPKTYSAAKKECEKALAEHRTEMEQIAADALEGNGASGKFYDNYYYVDPENGYVVYEIDAQGMLGGQYWELVYTTDGTFGGETESYLYEETGGNNIRKAEKLDAHWWYLWTDYDGTARSNQ